MTGDELRTALEELAANLAYSWLTEIRQLFRDLDAGNWDEIDHNPVILLQGLSANQLEQRAEDTGFVDRVLAAQSALAEELRRPGWWTEQEGPEDFLVAYFSTEFALDESVPVYSGGLGV